MDYYATMRNDYVQKQMYPSDTRADWIPKGPPSGTLTIKPKDRCPPRFVTKIEGNAVEEGVKVFFEGIVDAQPQPKFSWYFNDEPIVPGQRGFQEAEIHDSRKMSTLILKYAREHNMGKYTLVASNQLGTAESHCDLIVRKKQFPPVFWQRLYNVSGQADSTRFVGGVEVGGWPVPTVYWYRVLEDGEEVEVTTRTHTENWNGNPNKYVPSSKVEIRQIDQIRHCIIFNQVGEGYSGLYRVRAVNCLGEAECEAELSFDGEGGGGDEMFLPPLWREKRRLTWRDEDQRKKPFVGFNEPELSSEELEAMKKGSGLVPLSRITEYLASLPDYVPTNKFSQMERLPFKAGVDEQDYRPTRAGGSPRFPGKFEKGKIVHRNYNVDGTARILPRWQNKADPRSPNSADWTWAPVHPDLFEPQFPPRSGSPEPTPVWEKAEDISLLIQWLRSLGCRGTQVEITAAAGQENTETVSHQGGSAVKKFSYIRDNKEDELKLKEKKQAKHTKQSALVDHQTQQSQQSQQFHQTQQSQQSQKTHQSQQSHQTHQSQQSHQTQQSHQSQQALQTQQSQQTLQALQAQQSQQTHQATNQVSQNISVESQSGSNVTTTYESRTSLQSQQTFQESESEYFTAEIAKPIYHKQENLSFPELDRIAQPPPALPPKTKIMHSPSRNIFSPTESIESTGTASVKTVEFIPVKEKIKMIAAQQEELMRREEASPSHSDHKQKGVRILPPSPVTVRKMMVEQELQNYDTAVTRTTPVTKMMESKEVTVTSSQEVRRTEQQQLVVPGWTTPADLLEQSGARYDVDQAFDQLVAESATPVKQLQVQPDAAEQCRRSFEEAELEALALESQSSHTFSKQSSMVETGSVQSFVYQEGSAVQSSVQTNVFKAGRRESTNSEDVSISRSRKTLRSPGPFIRSPETFTSSPQSAPATPLSQRRRLRVNQSPKPQETADNRPNYREQLTGNAFQPGFYRPPPEDSSKGSGMFQVLKGKSSKMTTNTTNTTTSSQVKQEQSVRVSHASSTAYEGDSEL